MRGSMAADGADIIDIGAESTRPYGTPSRSARRGVAAPRAGFAGGRPLGVPVSIDTMKPRGAWALGAGASIVNDVWGLQRDPDMARVVADHGVPVIAMHNRERADAPDIMADIEGLLRPHARNCAAAPASRAKISCSTLASASA